MVRLLRDRGIVSAAEWTTALNAQLPGTGTEAVNYRHWLAALEEVLCGKGLVSDDALRRHRDAWAHAAQRTPHGEPIELAAADFPD